MSWTAADIPDQTGRVAVVTGANGRSRSGDSAGACWQGRARDHVLPASIARRLKAGERPLADRFDDVAVLFADLVDFTPMSEKLAPEKVVAILDRLFSEFEQ